MLIKGFEEKNEIDRTLDKVLEKVKDEGSAGMETPQTRTTIGFQHKGFFIQALSPDGLKWKGMARDMFDTRITLESQWFLTENPAIQEVMKYVDIYSKRLV